ncbi:MAG: PAS domain S-box-containing protein, partial [Porticoccus sp.]
MDTISALFQPPIESLIYDTSYNYTLVIISILIAIFASLSALKSSLQISHSEGALNKATWSIVSSLTLGIGIWAMHFIGMLALNLPSIITYDPVLTMLSVIPSIAAAGITFGFVWHTKTHLSVAVRSLILGAGIGIMHYTGMMAMRLEGFMLYNPVLFILSLCAAIFLAYCALSVRIWMIRLKKQQDVLVAIVLGGAVSGIHYTGMASTYFMKSDEVIMPATFWTTDTLAFTVAITTTSIAAGTMVMALIGRLRDSEQRLKFVLNGAGDGAWDWHPQTNQVKFSSRWKEIIGYADDELPDTDNTFYKLVHPDDRKRVRQTFREQVTNSALPFATEFRMQCIDNTWVWILSRGKVVGFDAGGNPTRMIGTHTDITKRKKAEEQLQIAATAFEITDGVMITDSKGTMLKVNRAFTEITGYTAEEAIGQNPRILSSVRQDKEFYRAMWETIIRTGQWEGEVFDKHKNGKVHPTWLTISAVRDDSGNTTH